MNAFKRERNASMSPVSSKQLSASPRQQQQNNGKANGRHRTTSSPHTFNTNGYNNTTTNRQKEKGIIEKLLTSYGFVECASTGYRVFFHYSEFEGDPNDLSVGDCVQFYLTNDPRNNKLLAIQLSKLPAGSVVIETLSEEVCIGRVEVEPRPIKNGESPDPSTLGRVSYDKSGEFFFLPFTMNDIENGYHIRKGDTISFFIGTNKRTGSLKARKIKYANAAQYIKTVQGIISSLKDSFGFIERADMVAEIFFHYSEYGGEVNDLMIGDDVEFQLQNRSGKEIAIAVKKLEPGTVVFEDISPTRFKGHVIKALNARGLNNSADGHLTGMIEYQGKTDTHEVLFGDRDTEDDMILHKGDVVEFNVSTDRRDKLQRAVNIKLISVALKEGQKRDYGAVSGIKDGFGFIKCADQEASIFFHFSEVMEQSHIINLGDEVEFTIETDQISRRQHATRIRFLPKGSVIFETVSSKRHIGVIEQEAPERNMKSPSKMNKEPEYGIIKSFLEGKETEIYYKLRDCKPREFPRYRDKVEYTLITRKSNNALYAREISILEVHENKLVKGYICALKETFGFIESENHNREIFFHYSELDGDPNSLELGDRVSYLETKKSDKRSAESVSKCANGKNDDKKEISNKVYNGIVIKPMRIVDPEQAEYEGMIEKQSEVDDLNNDEKQATNKTCYPFGITSMQEKKEALQIGDKVTFQVYYDEKSHAHRAINISCRRNTVRGKIESVKGQFGFITYNGSEDGRSVFFHLSEVIDDHGKPLQVGDDVSFVIVKSHKNAKKSALRVQKIVDERPEHLSRRRSNRFSECANANKVGVLRQPKGPDGTVGFALDRSVSHEEVVLKEQISAIKINSEEEQCL